MVSYKVFKTVPGVFPTMEDEMYDPRTSNPASTKARFVAGPNRKPIMGVFATDRSYCNSRLIGEFSGELMAPIIPNAELATSGFIVSEEDENKIRTILPSLSSAE